MIAELSAFLGGMILGTMKESIYRDSEAGMNTRQALKNAAKNVFREELLVVRLLKKKFGRSEIKPPKPTKPKTTNPLPKKSKKEVKKRLAVVDLETGEVLKTDSAPASTEEKKEQASQA